MPNSVGLVPRNRLGWIPSHLRLPHEYCFFLHDEIARMLVEYEEEEAHFVSIKFANDEDALRFRKQADAGDVLSAMRASGYEPEARRLILNQITMAMVSDCAHHIYEALRCLEKRKVIVAFNLLRKPLTDNLLYLSWMLGNEDEFYSAFSADSPKGITTAILKGRRREILSDALQKTSLADDLTVDFLNNVLFDRRYPFGFQKLFQHAVHLITVRHMELRTEPENFNFIFKNFADDDLYEATYDALPHILLYLSHVVLGLFQQIVPSIAGAKNAFEVRSILGLYLVKRDENGQHAVDQLVSLPEVKCPNCKRGLKITLHNAARIVLTETFRCTHCRRVHHFPFFVGILTS